MKVVNVQQAKTHLSRLIDQAAEGQEFILGKHGKPLAKITAYAPRKEQRPLGGYEGRIRVGKALTRKTPELTGYSRVHELPAGYPRISLGAGKSESPEQ